MCLYVCVFVEYSEVVLCASLRFMKLLEELAFSSPARAADKRNGFHAVHLFTLTSDSSL